MAVCAPAKLQCTRGMHRRHQRVATDTMSHLRMYPPLPSPSHLSPPLPSSPLPTLPHALRPSISRRENFEVGFWQRVGRQALANLAAVLVILLAFGAVVSVKVFTNSLDEAYSQKCQAKGLILACNANLDWRRPAQPAACGGGACSLGDLWGVSALASTSGNQSRVMAQMVAARTPMAWEISGEDTSVDLLLADACRFDEASRSLLSKSQIRQTGAAGEACLARLLPSEVQAAALLQGSYVQSSITYSMRDAVSGQEETTTEGADVCRKCICWSLMNTKPSLWSDGVSWPTAKIQLPNGSGVCDSQFRELTMQTWTVAGAGVVVVVLLNAVLRVVVSWLGTFKRLPLVSVMEASMARAVFVGQFANTALVTMLVYAEVQTIKDALQKALHRDVLDRFPFFAGRFPDLSPQWYGRVGVALFITVLCNLALPFVSMFFAVANRWWSSCVCCLRGPYTARSLARSLQAPRFELGARYGMVLNFTFTSLMLTSGMPALWLVAALLFLITYMVDKIVLLRLSRTPVNYSRTISDLCIGWFKYAAVLHMAMSVWTFSATNRNADGPSFPRLSPFAGNRVSNCSAFTEAAICAKNTDCIWIAPAVNRRASAAAAAAALSTLAASSPTKWGLAQAADGDATSALSLPAPSLPVPPSRHLLQQSNTTALSNGTNITGNVTGNATQLTPSNVSAVNVSNVSRTHTTSAAPTPSTEALAAPATVSSQNLPASAAPVDGGWCAVRDTSLIYSFAERVFNVIT